MASTACSSRSDSRERQRRPHKKSRKGCTACKRRHVKCDERTPICTNCLVRGRECYTTEVSQPSHPSASSSIMTALSVAPGDPFDTLPSAMPGRSPEVLYHTRCHLNILISTLHGKEHGLQDDSSTACSFRTGLSKLTQVEPAWFQIVLLMTLGPTILAQQVSGNFPAALSSSEQTFLYHRQGVLSSLQGHVSTNMMSYPALALMWGMAVIDYAVGESEAAAHIQGVFALRDQLFEVDPTATSWMQRCERFVIGNQALVYAVRSQQQESSLTDALTIVLQGSNCLRRYEEAFRSPLTISLFQHIIHAFQNSLILWDATSSDPARHRRPDRHLLQWLYGRLEARKEKVEKKKDKKKDKSKDKKKDKGEKSDRDTNLSAVELSASMYAVVVGSFDMADSQRGDPLQPLRSGFSDVEEEWETAGGMINDGLVQHIAVMMIWLETSDGLRAMAHMIGQ